MKVKMGEIDGKMVIYRRNLGQNSRWNTNLPLKFKFGRWITLLTLESHLGRQIALEKGAKYLQKVGNLSAIFCGHRRLFGEIVDLSAIYWRLIAKNRPPDFSLGNVVSPPPNTRYIADIFRYFPP